MSPLSEIIEGDSRHILATLAESSIDSVVTDPPYALLSINKRFANSMRTESTELTAAGPYYRTGKGFMGKNWDTGETAFDPLFWREVLRVLKPGGHLLAFSGTRTYHRLAVAIEDAGFEIRDQIGWLYGSGFPKSHDVSKGIDKAAGAERIKVRIAADQLGNPPNLVGGAVKGDDRPWRQAAIERGYHEKDGDEPASDAAREWQGWGTALKPAWEPIVMARKPFKGTVAGNVQAHGTGAINIDGCRVGEEQTITRRNGDSGGRSAYGRDERKFERVNPPGRWPANVIHDGSEEVLAAFPEAPGQMAKAAEGGDRRKDQNVYGAMTRGSNGAEPRDDGGSAARFFYCAKASKSDREAGNTHPTVKPTALMRYLCRLVTPPGGTVLDPFMGSGSTGKAAALEGFNFIGIEREAEYAAIARARLGLDPFA
jgi:DNA modification methylase